MFELVVSGPPEEPIEKKKLKTSCNFYEIIMVRFVIVCVLNGILFGVLDAMIHANPYARRLFEIYKPIARETINAPTGIVIDIIYGFILGFVFLILDSALPGNSGFVKGLSFGLLVWLLRVLMNAISSWMMYKVPVTTLVYIAATGLMEMLILGIICGLFLKPINF